MKKRLISSLLVLSALFALVAPGAIAADLNDVGYVDQTVVGSLPAFVRANGQLAAYKAQLDQQFAAAMKSAKSDADRQTVTMSFQQKFADKQRELVGPLFQRAQFALASVADKRKLSIIVDKRIVVYGGQDATSDVVNLIKSNQAIAPPSASPPPSSIGFVDQSALDGSQKVKDANDQLQKYIDAQKPIYAQRIKDAKTDAERNDIGQQFDKAVSDKRDQLLKPLVEQTKTVTADIAKKKNLVLVIDRGDVIFGGTDITQDVQNALK